MYLDFIRTLTVYIGALEAACDLVDEASGLAPHLNFVPVILDDTLCGALVDDMGGTFHYVPATPAHEKWFKEMPKWS